MVKVFLITFQHVSGCQLPLLQCPKRQAPHLEEYFFTYLRQFLADNEPSMEVACVKPLQIERDDDRFLMDIACEDDTLDKTMVNKINYCILFLEVHRISDICTADRNFIFDSVYIGQRNYGSSASRVLAAVQERPEMRSWGIWRNFLKSLCTEQKYKLSNPLGNWIQSVQTSERIWPFYYSAQQNKMFRSYRED